MEAVESAAAGTGARGSRGSNRVSGRNLGGKALGRAVRSRREALAMKRPELAWKSQMTVEQLARLERGETVPDALGLKRLAVVMDTSVDALLREVPVEVMAPVAAA